VPQCLAAALTPSASVCSDKQATRKALQQGYMRRNFDTPRQLLPSASSNSSPPTSPDTIPSSLSGEGPPLLNPLVQSDSPQSPAVHFQALHVSSETGVQHAPGLSGQNSLPLLCSEDSLSDTDDSRHTSLGDSEPQVVPTYTYPGFAQHPVPVVPQNHCTWYTGPTVCDFPTGEVSACQLCLEQRQLRVYNYIAGQWFVTTYYIGIVVPAPDWYWWE
jgi:hypothetical protein